MSIPITVECKYQEVTLLAANVFPKVGLTKMEGNKTYYRTWVLKDEPAPLLPVNLENPRDPITSPWIELPEFNSEFLPVEASDLYIYCTGGVKGLSGYIEVAR